MKAYSQIDASKYPLQSKRLGLSPAFAVEVVFVDMGLTCEFPGLQSPSMFLHGRAKSGSPVENKQGIPCSGN